MFLSLYVTSTGPSARVSRYTHCPPGSNDRRATGNVSILFSVKGDILTKLGMPEERLRAIKDAGVRAALSDGIVIRRGTRLLVLWSRRRQSSQLFPSGYFDKASVFLSSVAVRMRPFFSAYP